MPHISERTDPSLSLPCLRLLVPPLRLVSGAIWETVQQRDIASYGLLDDFVTAITEIVPELLNRRQRFLLSLGLRTQLALEQCRPGQTIDMETIQPHLDIITSLLNTEISASGDGSPASNFLGLIHTLIKNQGERQHFFQDVFPVAFGDKYYEDIQRIVEIFLLQLDKLLTVPSYKQVASMLGDKHSVLSECGKPFCQSQEVKSLLEYLKVNSLCQLNEHGNQKVGASICSALCLPRALTKRDKMPQDSNVFEYMDTFNKELTVEKATQIKSADDVKTQIDKSKKSATETRGLDDQFFVHGEGVEDEVSSSVQHVEALGRDDMSVDTCDVVVQVGYNDEILAEDTVITENTASVEDSAMDIEEDKRVQASVSSTDDSEDGVMSPSETENSIKEKNDAVSSSIIISDHVNNMDISVEVLNAPVVITSKRPVRQSRGLKVKSVSITPKDECSKRVPQVPSTNNACPTCGKAFSRSSDLLRHQRIHTGVRPYQCSQCKRRFLFRYDLRKHERKVCGVTAPQPKNCSFEEDKDKDTEDPTPPPDIRAQQNPPTQQEVQLSDQKEQSQEPQQDDDENKPVDTSLHCAECDRSFQDTARLQLHNLRHKSCSCTKCDESFKGYLDLKQHYIKVHNFRGPFPCTLCKRTYTELRGLIRHKGFHTGDLPFRCSKCPKTFSSSSALKLHNRTHTRETPFLCWDCGKSCRSNGILRSHRLAWHSSAEEKRFCCEHCGKAYALKGSLDLHVAKLHTGVRYPCSHCGKLFLSPASLTRHNLIHTKERPYSCFVCGKSFRTDSELKIHSRFHTGERPFKCEECGKGFVRSCYLTTHMMLHTGERPYRCPTCDKGFKTHNCLTRHIMIHTGEKPFKCSACEKAYNRATLLRAHVRKFH